MLKKIITILSGMLMSTTIGAMNVMKVGEDIRQDATIRKALCEEYLAENGYIFAKMSGILDLSSDENAKHLFPRKFSDAPTWMRMVLSMMRKRSWNLSDVLTVSELPYMPCSVKA